MSIIPDQAARTEALNTNESYIVQAPAGSGKTSLLTQRYLALLAKVNNPEEIVAITFTKKAAAEMQERIFEALELGKSSPPTESYLLETHRLAQLALKQNKKCQWKIFQNKNRLRILTIDAFCLYLTNRMPLLSKAIPFSELTDQPSELYRLAAEKCIATALNSETYFNHLSVVQDHLGNNPQRLIDLFILMLGKREQWLRHVVQAKDFKREYFEYILETIQNQLIAQINSICTSGIKSLLESTLIYQQQFHQTPVITNSWIDWDSFNFWQSLSNLILNQKGEFRKRFTKKDGFPPGSSFKSPDEIALAKEIKTKLDSILHLINENQKLSALLQQAQIVPSTAYTDEQWRVLQSVIALLPLLAAELSITFSQESKVDFNEIALQAIQALGYEGPSELALYLDYEIKHLLVDEFQDTSKRQFHLLERLTESWIEGEGRTLFLVGDPMQSIYRFREADVGLFITAWQHGINQIRLNPLSLNCNFRSSAAIVEQVNTICKAIFPARSDSLKGAVSYAPSQTLSNEYSYPFIGISCLSKEEESLYLAEYIKQHPNEEIAILVRSRSQLSYIVSQLQLQNINIEGIDLENIANNYYIGLLLSILNLHLNPDDTLSFANILSSPLCGLNYQELEILCSSTETHFAPNKCYQNLSQLPVKIQQRVEKVLTIFKWADSHRYRLDLLMIIHQVWHKLHGHACLDENQKKDVEQFWLLLENQKQLPFCIEAFKRKLSSVFSSHVTTSPVKIMTIHKSKGLEFHTVILPSVEYYSVDTDTPLLSWYETNENDLLLSPIHNAFEQQDQLTKFIRNAYKEKDNFERQRLFYVALTRAKKKVIFLRANSEVSSIPKGSFLHYINNFVEFEPLKISENTIHSKATSFLRLEQSYFEQYEIPLETAGFNEMQKNIFPEWQQILGTFIHEQLYFFAEEHCKPFSNIDYAEHKLIEMGLDNSELDSALKTYQQCIENILKSDTGLWIFDQHQQANNEYQLATKNGNYIIDRTFVENNTRWIIDYKITYNAEHHLDKYKQQLNHYASLFHQIKQENIKLMLYYPLLNISKEWQYISDPI